jgi:hypothetical protein
VEARPVVQIAQLEIGDETGEALARAARRRGQSVDDVLRSLLGLAEERAAGEQGDGGFDAVWKRICEAAGTEFVTRNRQRFTYLIDGNYVAPSTSDVRIPVSQFRKAHAMGPVRGPSSLRGVFAPSLVWAILNDERVRNDKPTRPCAPGIPAQTVVGMRGDAQGDSDVDASARSTWPDDSGMDVGHGSVGAWMAVQLSAETLDHSEDTIAVPAAEPPPRAGPSPATEPPADSRGFFRRVFGRG